MSAPELAGIVISGLTPAPIPPPQPNLLERISNRLYNLARRPLVRLRTREVLRIASGLKKELSHVITQLEAFGATCPICRFNAMNLKAEVFASTMERIVTRGKCNHHPGPYVEFDAKHRVDFERSEKLSAWINGF